MSLSVLDMSVSLDGFVADAHDYLGGEDGERLHAWAESQDPSRPVKQFEDEWNAAGAILAGRRTAELMDHWGGSHGGLPIFVPSHRPPPPAARWGYPLVTYVSDGIESAMAQAKAAAADKNVQVRGANVAQRALEAGVLDEIQIHQIPVLLGEGRRLFDVLPGLIELEIRHVIDTPEATHIRYGVRH
ncbi:dihydrofolate reductase family protein [Aeromicrobium ginsengisoli]|uniref:Riboflavin biosynthesis protein RibD n=1 Tax=Aeromicrobium ginsengisoli TaxID=363867 RepID=A0A5M4FHK6_9ACTN|nr:dihydrofolate reductase family protein [Aeromicrobium ginsengisoli]KAA1399432.1 riboflavin biosynthesis protein RibD [Aeromicrobium ginsengisoli]